MGQYFLPLILGPAGESPEFIRAWMESFDYGSGSKMTEHSYLNNEFVNALEFQLSPQGPFWKSRLVWAGDYDDAKLYERAVQEGNKKISPPRNSAKELRYIVNHTKAAFVDKAKLSPGGPHGLVFHPLPLLTAQGNGQGGGDYRGNDAQLVGSWAYDTISVEREMPQGYQELVCDFRE